MSTIQQIRIEELPQHYCRLGAALIRMGLGSHEAHGELESGIIVRCAECHIPISGTEFALMAVAAAHEPEEKLGRMKRGYCARRGCRSFYCELVFTDSPKVNWQAAWAAAVTTLDLDSPALESPEQLQAKSLLQVLIGALTHKDARHKTAMAAACLCALAGFLIWYFYVPEYARVSTQFRGVTSQDLELKP